jgi:hypothetical protein
MHNPCTRRGNPVSKHAKSIYRPRSKIRNCGLPPRRVSQNPYRNGPLIPTLNPALGGGQ